MYRQSNYWYIKFSTIYWNVPLSVFVSSLARLGGLVATSVVLDISEITHIIDHEKPSSISQLTKDKSGDLQNYSNSLMEQQIFCLIQYF